MAILEITAGHQSSTGNFPSPVHEALRGLLGIACIADDILTYGSDDTLKEAQRDHDGNMAALLDRCCEKGLKLNRDKLQLNRKSTRYMGHKLTSSGLAINRRKQDAIRQMTAHTNRKGVMRIIGE